jgi:hypothetical protein
MSENKKQAADSAVIGINMGIFAAYTILGVTIGDEAVLVSFFIAVFHVIIAIIMAVVQHRGIWVLVALLILVIGIGTCVSHIH